LVRVAVCVQFAWLVLIRLDFKGAVRTPWLVLIRLDFKGAVRTPWISILRYVIGTTFNNLSKRLVAYVWFHVDNQSLWPKLQQLQVHIPDTN